MMSQPNNNMSVIKASIDYLSSKFDQLLDDHQNILMKQRQDNANIMNQKHGVDPKHFNNLFQEQEQIQNSIEYLAQLEESYHNEAHHLKDLIIDDYQNFRHYNQSSENVKGLRDPITALKSYIEINLGSLQTKVLSADGMEQLEIQVMRKLQTYFNEAFNGMEEAFMNYSNMSKKYSGKNSQQYDPIQIEQFCSHNFLTIESAAGGLDSIQQILIDHNDAMGSLSSKYKKESKLLQENLNHIKQRLYVKTKETSENRTSLRSSSGSKQDRSAEKSTKTGNPSLDSKELLLMDQLVTQVIATNAYKNEVFNAIKKAADSLQFRLQEKVDSLAGNLKTLKETGGTLRESVAESQQERPSAQKSLTPPKRMARCQSQENASFMDQSSMKKRQTRGSVEKKEHKKPSPSPIRSKSPQQPQEQKIYKTKSVGKLHQENPRLSDKDVDLLVKELRRSQNQFESYSNTMDQKLLKLHYNAQKFLNSSEKIAELINKRGEEEIYALKIYQHDYTILRDSLNKLFVSHEAHQERRNSPTRSASQELLKQRERSAKRLGPHLNTEQSREESNERVPAEGNDKKINEIMHNLEKAQTDILKTIYRDESYIHKTLETDEDFQVRGREKGKLKTEKSQEEFGKFNRDGNQDLEKKFEKLLQEFEILKKENEELYKKARKVREKADERKKTLKQLFELVMEKDKDINAYKEALKGKGEGTQKKKDDIIKAFEAKSNELLLKVGYLEKKLLDKEFKLKSLNELTQKLMQSRQIKESKSAKSGLKLPKSGSRDDLRDSGKKTRQSPEIRGKNKDALDEVIEIKDYINKEADNLLSLINPKGTSSSQDVTAVEQSLEILKAEKKELEERYHQMLEEMGKIHDDKSKLESEHQQEISQLREKVKNLHEKVQHDDGDDHFKTPQKSNKLEQQEVIQETTNNMKVKEALNERILELSKDLREGVEEYRRNPVESAEKSQDFDFTKLNLEITELQKINEDLTVQIQKINEEKDKEISSLNELVSILRKEIEDINDKYTMKQEPLMKDNKALKAQIETLNVKVNGIFEWMKEDYKGPSSSFMEENLEKLQIIIKQKENSHKDTIEKIHNKVKEDQARESEKFRVMKEENSKIIAENNEKMEGLKQQLDEKIKEYENKVKELKQKVIEHEVANIELKQSMSIVKEDLQSKENSISTQKKELTAKITELEVLVENYKNAIGSQNNELAENNVKLETKIKELEDLIAKKEGEVESKKKNLAMKNLEVKNLAERLAGEENTLQLYKHDLNTKEEELITKTEEYENKINDLTVQIEGYKKEVGSENVKRKSLEEKILKLEGSMENVKKEKSSKDNDYELKIQDYESRLQDLESTKEAQKLDIISLANDLNTQKDSFIDNIQELEKTIDSLKEEASMKTEKFIQDLAVYQTRIQELETTIETQKTGLEKELKEAKTRYEETIHAKINELKQQKEDSEVKISELEQELNKANKSYEEAEENNKVKLSELESQKADLEQELKESKAGHQALVEAMNVKESHFNHQKEGSEARFAEFESQKAFLKQEFEEAKTTYEEAIAAKVNDFKQLTEVYEAKIAELEQNIQGREELQAQQKQEFETSLDTLKEEITSKNNFFNHQTEAYQKQIKDLEAKNEAQRLDISSRNNDLDTQSKELRKKLSDYEVSISIYKEEVGVKDKDLKSQAKELEELKEKLKFKQAEMIAMDLDNQGLIKRLNVTEEEKTKIETVLNLFDSKLSEFTSRYIAVHEEQETQEEKSLQDFEKNLQKRMGELENLVQNRQIELEDLTKMSEKERELLQNDKENLERRVQDIEVNITKTIETCERLERETQILNEKNSELLTAKDRLEQELEKREVDVKSLTDELQILKEAISSAQEENAKIMEGTRELETLEKDREDQQREIDNILQSKTQLEVELENVKVVKEFAEKRVEELEQKLTEVEEMYDEKEKYSREVEVRCQGITDVLEELGEQRKKFIQDKNEERARYEKKIKELKEEINRMTEEQERVIKVKKSTSGVEPDNEEERKRLEENIKELNTEKEALLAEINKKNEDLQYMKEKSENLQAALQNAGKRISQLIEEKEELEKGIIEEVDSQQGFDSLVEVDEKERIIEELKQSNEENTRQLDEALAQNQQLQQKIHEVKAELENNKSEFEKKESGLKSRIEGLLQGSFATENEIEALTHQLNVSSETLTQKEQIIIELNKNIENLYIELQVKENKINELRESSQKDNQVLFQENDQLKEETKSKQLKVQELEEELEQLGGQWDKVKERIEELQTSLSHKESLIVEINNLNSEVNEQVKTLQEEISENKKVYEQDIRQLETELKEDLNKKDQEIAQLNQTLQEKYRITVEYKDHKEEMEAKKQKISELEKQVQELQQNLQTETSQKEMLDNTIADLRREIEGETGERLSQRDLHIDELTQRIATLEKSQLELGEENKVLRSITQRGTRTRSGDFNLDKSEILCTSPNEEDDIKTKSYLTGNILNRSFDMNTKRLSEEEYIHELHEKSRTLQDENEKLEAENKQLKSEYELSRIMDEDLRSDLVDKDEEMKRLQFQLVVLKEELSKADKKSQSQDSSPLMAPQASISHEKEHIRTIFSKFMENLSQGNSKEVEGLLKLLTSLLDFDETAKSQLINGLKSKSSKKGMLGRLF